MADILIDDHPAPESPARPAPWLDLILYIGLAVGLIVGIQYASPRPAFAKHAAGNRGDLPDQQFYICERGGRGRRAARTAYFGRNWPVAGAPALELDCVGVAFFRSGFYPYGLS